jgi:tetratricopeptide (TPR) repeat protein
MRALQIILFGWICVTSFAALAQDERTLEYLRQEEQRKKAELMRQLDSGVYFMDIGEYTLADKKLKYVLENIKSVPSDLTYYFGKNSFYLKRYKQSIDWLNKYIQLKGTSGQYYAEATDILNKAQEGLLSERAVEAKKAEQVLSQNYDIDCGPSGKVSCPVCKGDHVIIKKGTFGDEYRTCPYCNEHGMLTCVEYNQLLRGELQKKQ